MANPIHEPFKISASKMDIRQNLESDDKNSEMVSKYDRDNSCIQNSSENKTSEL